MSELINKKNENLVSDPHELLLSLVDMGSLDIEDVLMACVAEMSDAECKRVLSGLSLPSCCSNVEDSEDEMSDETPAEEETPSEEPAEGELEVSVEDAQEDMTDNEDREDDAETELEARIRRLERCVRRESMNRNRIRRFPRRRTNR